MSEIPENGELPRCSKYHSDPKLNKLTFDQMIVLCSYRNPITYDNMVRAAALISKMLSNNYRELYRRKQLMCNAAKRFKRKLYKREDIFPGMVISIKKIRGNPEFPSNDDWDKNLSIIELSLFKGKTNTDIAKKIDCSQANVTRIFKYFYK